jgi:hypothetical protein
MHNHALYMVILSLMVEFINQYCTEEMLSETWGLGEQLHMAGTWQEET